MCITHEHRYKSVNKHRFQNQMLPRYEIKIHSKYSFKKKNHSKIQLVLYIPVHGMYYKLVFKNITCPSNLHKNHFCI